jgi:TonB family protein
MSEVVTYLPSPPESKPLVKKRPPRVVFNAKAVVAEQSPQKSAAAVGTEFGSVGSTSGIDARPALPVVFPDPAIFPWQLPNGLTGDVIVEVTIDDQGAVTETRLLQSLKPDIDQKVVATVRNWRFRPATVDGVAISSRQDVHFHYPG